MAVPQYSIKRGTVAVPQRGPVAVPKDHRERAWYYGSVTGPQRAWYCGTATVPRSMAIKFTLVA